MGAVVGRARLLQHGASGRRSPKAEAAASPEEALQQFDANAKAARDAMAAATDRQLLGSWSLLVGNKTLFSMPRIAVLRSFIFNHMIHHRAQMGVYLRLLDVPVPAIYGPSADENVM